MQRSRTRRAAVSLLSLAMGLGMIAVAAPPASADVEPVGPITFTTTDGVIKAGNAANETTGGNHGIILPLSCEPADGLLPEFPTVDLQDIVDAAAEPCDPDAPQPQLSGSVDVDGNITIPEANINFPPSPPAEAIPGTFAAMSIVPDGDATGTIVPNPGIPAEGSVSISISLAISVELTGGLVASCEIPMSLNLTGPYNHVTGVATIADSSFPIVIPATPCDNPAVGPLIPVFLGQTTAGLNVIRFVMDVTPKITEAIPPGPPTVGNASATIALGGSATRSFSVIANPTATCALDGVNGGATLAESVTLNPNNSISYVHDETLGDGVDVVDYTCTNALGSNSGSFAVTVLGNACQAGLPDEAATGCHLDQLIEFTITGDVMTMEQEEAEVALSDLVLNGAPQVSTGAMNQLTIVNRRGDGARWDLVGQVSDFRTGGFTGNCPSDEPDDWDYRCIPGDNLGWTPASEVVHEQVPGDVAAVDSGSPITAADIADGDLVGEGMGSDAQALCSSDETVSGGTFACGAGLALVVPASASSGTYEATLTLTLS